MVEPDHISGPTGYTGQERPGLKRPQNVVADPIRHAEAIDWWQEQRWAARAFCRSRDAELRKVAQARIDALPLQALVREPSVERQALELEILQEIHQNEVHLASELEHILSANLSDTNVLTDYAGWSVRDLGQLALGGSGTAAVAAVAARASPGLLGMIGLGAASAFVAPFAVTVGAAAFAWSAASVIGGKRQAYLTLVQDAVTRLLIAEGSVQGSVLSRHLNRIDAVYRLRSENVS